MRKTAVKEILFLRNDPQRLCALDKRDLEAVLGSCVCVCVSIFCVLVCPSVSTFTASVV